MIRACRIGQVHHTPFDPQDAEAIAFFDQQGIVLVDSPLRCDLFVTGHFFPVSWKTLSRKLQLLLRYQHRRTVLVWTDEPWNMIESRTFRWSLLQPAAHIMNVYTRDVHLSNFTNSTWAIKGPIPLKTLADCPESGQARIIGLVGYVENPMPRLVMGQDRDLNRLRMSFLEEGWRRKRMDIFGGGWPLNMSKEASREGNWWDRKLELLGDYDICLALENTAFDYYCTEKIWQAIVGGCLPIYYGKGSRIYETFPRDSFVDAAEYDNVGQIFDFIDRMPRSEFMDRYNRCADVNNRVAREVDFAAERRAMLMKVAERIHEISGRQSRRIGERS